ncbi:MAG: adenylyltransferase/cytidyltransferase family protein [bacterium]|nr:adenylyltransferase/cytidyltransferase family protein [bacterium]
MKKALWWAPDLSARRAATNRHVSRRRAPVDGTPVWVAVSGGFDPLHIGHVRMFRAARKLGDKLVVIMNNDNWLRAKKGFTFMPQKERAEIIKSFPFVDKVVLSDHKKGDTDKSVCRILAKVRPAIFANGGDRVSKNVPEVALCKKLGIKMIFNVGQGGKVQSSSWMISNSRRPASKTVRPWGEYYGWDQGKDWNLKTIYITPKQRLSLQYHHHREEWWLLVEGDATATVHEGKEVRTIPLRKGEVFRVRKGQVHRLSSKKGGVVVEVAHGAFDEEDIVRLEDDHGRPTSKLEGR